MDHSNQNLIIPKIIADVYEQYASIPVPYYRSNKSLQLKRRVFKGKGSFEEINSELQKLRLKSKSNITDAELLQNHHIGIDCSGFVNQLYDAYTMQEKSKHVWEFFSRRFTNPIQFILGTIQPIVSKLNATTLCSDTNTIQIATVREIKPMDLIKFSGGKHLGIVYEIKKINGKVEQIDYIHSTEGIGVTKNSIKILDENKGIIAQQWGDKTIGARYEPSYLIRYSINQNGIRRPKFLI